MTFAFVKCDVVARQKIALETWELSVSSKLRWDLFLFHRCVCLALGLHIQTLLVFRLCHRPTVHVDSGTDLRNCNIWEKYLNSLDLVTNIGY